MKIKTLEDLNKVKQKGLNKIFPNKPRISVGVATCGIASGANEIYDAAKNYIEENNLNVFLTKTGCIGYCRNEPIVNISLPNSPILIFNKVSESDVPGLLEALINGNSVHEKALCKIEAWDHVTSQIVYGYGFEDIPSYWDIPFFKHQTKIVMRNCGLINPEDIEEYIAVGGYYALYKALKEMTPQQIIEEVKISGLRGRGGAGFPTGIKWEIAAKAESSEKYIICNADEGDPGAYMNRNEIESDPHMLIEGMLIGAYAIGARQGIIYVRAEYPMAIQRLQVAINQAQEYGILGDNIFGTDFSFNIIIAKGAGAFVCGEETALIASVEGVAGRPKPRPPFPVEKGLWGMPTVINNVETWCNIPVIILKGGQWYSKIGEERNSGTKVFSLVGKVKNVGLVEVALGSSLSKIVYEIGEGGINDKKIKAVQIGGPSGGCVPETLFDTSVDYEHLKEVGSIMGSGGIVVMDEDSCMIDTAKFFLNFTSDESCGKCLPCREGLIELYKLVDKITEGKSSKEDIFLIEQLCETIQKTSLCGLGQTAPNPVITVFKYFKDELDSHIEQKRCPAKVCKGLISYRVLADKCKGCTLCAQFCPTGAVSGIKGQPYEIDSEKCIRCGSCKEVCKFDAIYVE
ncbi:NADH-ubiquinone oxidoreductase-F iron-sulfur binding region domain-containing protein [Thermodesulfovibrio yellowstonii]|uniref:NADH-ubiquinone oxidoreductase-F iron-sulfur binding region domain-containing protein n=1 Tax=Thermodesulfovibrio yellowstonii TaxID=28262 RepID=UPI0024B3840E|nr:NADH-ubiquinone oxidoreductase-F iron-sulfur binding region domain-containing protein [Thermodesulfovibrio yellowstonii]MDI6864822.1 NADH-ubiquinone oxidoreductase-F iron-sulfur binding region domain-containing protein [Thermodesulfovibrio yellowstonii]